MRFEPNQSVSPVGACRAWLLNGFGMGRSTLGSNARATEEGHGEEKHHPELDHPAQFSVLESVIVRSLHPAVNLEGEQAVEVLVVQNDLPPFHQFII